MQSGTLEALWFEDEEPEEEITIIRHSQCVLEYSVNLIPDVSALQCEHLEKF